MYVITYNFPFLVELMGLVDSRTLYPPQHTCTNPSCERSKSGHLLKKEEQRQAVLYTLDKGAIPVRSVHLYCDSELAGLPIYYRPRAMFTGYFQSAGQTITTTFV
jgi:CxC5 like cysteine cluster associated with KDZ transposases